MFRQGDKLGPYTLIQQLGRGAFGVVWLAERRGAIATTQVALKITLDEDPDIEALRQEAELWSRAGGHPNVLPIIEADIYDNQLVIVSEYAPDGSLSQWLKQHGGAAPSMEAAVNMITGVLQGLKHLHSRRIIHRDLKPANILLQGDTPRLADFGIARIVKTGVHSGVAAGTPPYMAPEAFKGARDQQTDLWSAGIMFYQMVSGRVPFTQQDIASLCLAITNDPLPPLPASVPRPIQQIIATSLEKDTAKRYRNIAEMLEVLQRVASYAAYQVEPNDTFSSATMQQEQGSAATLMMDCAPQEQPNIVRPAPPMAARTVRKIAEATPINCPSCQRSDRFDTVTNRCLRCGDRETRTSPLSANLPQNRTAQTALQPGAPLMPRPANQPANQFGKQFGNQFGNQHQATRTAGQLAGTLAPLATAATVGVQTEPEKHLWRDLHNGLLHHTGSKSLPELAAKVIFVATMAVEFVRNALSEETLWDAIFLTAWHVFYAGAFALAGALIVFLITMFVNAVGWLKK